jgi:hypothetical protein
MKRVKGNADGQKNVEVRWLIDDTKAREQPLEILQQKVSVFENPSMLRFMQTLAINQARRAWRPLALAILAPSQKSIAVVEKSKAANGGFHAP